MPDEEMEQRHLLEANRHIAELEIRIAKQQRLVDKLKDGRAGRENAVHLLSILLESLQVMQDHRQMIVESLRAKER